MTRLTKALVVIGLVVALTVIGSGTALMAPAAPNDVSYDSLTVGCGTGDATTQSVPIVANNVGADGVAGFDISFSYDQTKMSITSVVAGSNYGGQANCSPTVQKLFDDGGTAYVTAACTLDPTPAVTGEVELMVVNFASVGGDIGPYTVTLLANPLGVPTGVWGPNNNKVAPGALLNGCTPTSVELSDMNANSASPAALSLWPLLAGGAVVAAGGAFAVMRRKR